MHAFVQIARFYLHNLRRSRKKFTNCVTFFKFNLITVGKYHKITSTSTTSTSLASDEVQAVVSEDFCQKLNSLIWWEFVEFLQIKTGEQKLRRVLEHITKVLEKVSWERQKIVRIMEKI